MHTVWQFDELGNCWCSCRCALGVYICPRRSNAETSRTTIRMYFLYALLSVHVVCVACICATLAVGCNTGNDIDSSLDISIRCRIFKGESVDIRKLPASQHGAT